MFKGELIKIENDIDIKKVKMTIREIIGERIYINAKYDFNGALTLSLVKAQNKFNYMHLNDLSIYIKDTVKFNTDDSVTITRKPNLRNTLLNNNLIKTGIIYNSIMKIESENDIKQALKHIEVILGHNINISIAHYDDDSLQKGCFKQGNNQSKFNVDDINLCINDIINFSYYNKVVSVTREENGTCFIKQDNTEFKTCSNDIKETTLEDMEDKVLIIENEDDIKKAKEIIRRRIGENHIGLILKQCENKKLTRITICEEEKAYFKCDIDDLVICLFDTIDFLEDNISIIRKSTRTCNKPTKIESLDNIKTKLQIEYNSERIYNLDTHVFFNKVDSDLNLLSIITRHNKKVKSELISKEVISKIIGYNNDYVLTLSQSDNYIGCIKLKNQDCCVIKEIYKSSYEIKDYILTDDNNLFILHDDFVVRIQLSNNHSTSIIKIEDNPIYSCDEYEINVVKINKDERLGRGCVKPIFIN